MMPRPVGALASKSRLMTASNWSSVWKTVKSSSGKKLDGKTRRPWEFTTKGFMHPPRGRSLRRRNLTTEGVLLSYNGGTDQAPLAESQGAGLPGCGHGDVAGRRGSRRADRLDGRRPGSAA